MDQRKRGFFLFNRSHQKEDINYDEIRPWDKLNVLPVCLCDILRLDLALLKQAIELRSKQHQQSGPRADATLATIINHSQATGSERPQASAQHG